MPDDVAETVYNILEDVPAPHEGLLPHQHDPSELVELFPQMPRPGERVDSLPDLASSAPDPIEDKGAEIARGIIREAELFGRRRRPVDAAASCRRWLVTQLC